MQRLAKSWSATSRRFESCIFRQFFCLVSSIGSEHRFTKPGVARSNRVRGTIFAVIAQLVERSVEGAGVVGSIPTHGTNFFEGVAQ
jgi:hypothetical protein